jgi:hypothetical protein
MKKDKKLASRLILYFLFAGVILFVYYVIGPSWLAARDYNNNIKCSDNLNELEKGFKIYRDKNGGYPENLNKLIQADIIKQLPPCPLSKTANYEYMTNLKRDSYCLTCRNKHNTYDRIDWLRRVQPERKYKKHLRFE